MQRSAEYIAISRRPSCLYSGSLTCPPFVAPATMLLLPPHETNSSPLHCSHKEARAACSPSVVVHARCTAIHSLPNL